MDILIVFLAKYLIWILFAAAAVLIGLEIAKTRNWRALGFMVLAGLTAVLFSQIFHLIPVEVYRPYQLMGTQPLIEPSVDSPFPSDHVTFAFTAAFAVFLMTRYKKIGLVVLLAAIGVLAGRLLALVHSPLDVVGGLICAGLGTVWYYIYHRGNLKKVPDDIKQLLSRAKTK